MNSTVFIIGLTAFNLSREHKLYFWRAVNIDLKLSRSCVAAVSLTKSRAGVL